MLKVLILCGGRGERMGRDKGMIDWHGKEQRYYLADLIGSLDYSVFLSCREEQAGSIVPGYRLITDKYGSGGPYYALLSAFDYQSTCAWLVIACDYPFLDAKTVIQLISKRNTERLATAFQNPHDGLPEPLLTIWEPRSGKVLQENQNHGSLRRILVANEIKLITPLDEKVLLNVNTLMEFKEAKTILSGNSDH